MRKWIAVAAEIRRANGRLLGKITSILTVVQFKYGWEIKTEKIEMKKKKEKVTRALNSSFSLIKRLIESNVGKHVT